MLDAENIIEKVLTLTRVSVRVQLKLDRGSKSQAGTAFVDPKSAVLLEGWRSGVKFSAKELQELSAWNMNEFAFSTKPICDAMLYIMRLEDRILSEVDGFHFDNDEQSTSKERNDILDVCYVR